MRRMDIIRNVVVTASLWAAIGAAAEPAQKWDIDKDHTSIGFTVKHFFTPVAGTFNEVLGSFLFDPENLDGSAIDVRIPVASIDTRNAKRDKHLQSEDFFDAKRWPDMHFVSERIEKSGENRFTVFGKLTIRDVTEDVVLPFKLDIAPDPADAGQVVARVTGGLTISRTKFGVGRDEWRDTKIVGDEVGLQIDVLARRKK